MRRELVRWTYLVAMGSLLIWIISSAVGGYAYKSGDGLVVGDMGEISPEYTVTVLDVLVKNGDRVKRGDVVARVSSTRVAEITALLSTQSSTLVSRMAEVSSKSEIMDALIGSAEMRTQVVETNSEQLREIRDKRLLPLLTDNALAEQQFKGKQELAILRAERESMGRQVPNAVAASRFTDVALEDIQRLFNAGNMLAPMTGYISGVEAGVGSVVNPGALVASMVGEKRYVLAYFPVSRLYGLQEGAPVTLEVGLGRWFTGTISHITPIAQRLPREFQKTLSPVDRQQLVRIDFDNEKDSTPYFTKVVVR